MTTGGQGRKNRKKYKESSFFKNVFSFSVLYLSRLTKKNNVHFDDVVTEL